MVLLHAGIADRTMWSEHLQPIAQAGYRVLAVDLPGFGEAPLTPGEQAPWMEVLRTMDELLIERAALVGIAFGGAMALRTALLSPSRVWALALVSAPAPGLEPSEELRAIWAAEGAALERGDLEGAVDAVVSGWTRPEAPVTLRERIAAMQRRSFLMQSTVTAYRAPDPIAQYPEALGKLEVGTLVAVGEGDTREFRNGAALLARTIPRARYAVIEGAGHLAPLEAPEAFRRVLLEFLHR